MMSQCAAVSLGELQYEHRVMFVDFILERALRKVPASRKGADNAPFAGRGAPRAARSLGALQAHRYAPRAPLALPLTPHHITPPVLSLPQPPPTPIGPVITETLAALLPEPLSLELLNAQYVQQHPGDARAVFAAARAANVLRAPRGEVEDTLFGVFAPEMQLDIKVRPHRALSNIC